MTGQNKTNETYHIEVGLTHKTFYINGQFLADISDEQTAQTDEPLNSANNPTDEITGSLTAQQLNSANNPTDDEIITTITTQIQSNLSNKSLINRLTKLFKLFSILSVKENTTILTIASNPHFYLDKYGFARPKSRDKLFSVDSEGNVHYQNEWSYLNSTPPPSDNSAVTPPDITDRYNFTSPHYFKFYSERAKFLKPLNVEAEMLYKQAELDSNKFIWRLRVQTIYDSIMNAYEASHSYSEEEKRTFALQFEEARAYLLNPDTPTPILNTIASLRGIDKEVLANKIIGKHNEQIAFYASINATKAKLLEDIEGARNKTEVREISLAPLKKYISEVGK